MGRDVTAETGSESFRQFTKAILRDLQALETMLQEGMIESGVRRIGAEQELFLVNEGMHPAPVGVEVLELGVTTWTTGPVFAADVHAHGHRDVRLGAELANR